MKKFMYLIPFAAVALASCSNESIDSQEQRVALSDAAALNIAPAIQGTTRGTVWTDANLTAFHVEAVGSEAFKTMTSGSAYDETSAVSAGTTISSDVNLKSGKWVIGDGSLDYYWPNKTMTAIFHAWAPTDASAGDYTVPTDIDNQKDIIVAYNSGAGGDFTSGVPLNFQHVMSQVIIKALNKDASDVKIEVAGVKLTNIKDAGKLNMPNASTASGTFSWSSYTPWENVSGGQTYTAGETSANTASGTTLSSVATQIASNVMLLMPQTTGKATSFTSTPITGAYLSVLIRATDLTKKVAQKNTAGKYVTSAGGEVGFDGAGTYTQTTEDAVAAAVDAAGTNATTITVNIGGSEQTIKLVNPGKYPFVGYANTSENFAYVCVPVDIDWKPGYKYTYTLNFSKEGIGKGDPNLADDAPADDYPSGKGGLAPEPGKDIVDSPVQLFFTVTVDEWTDAAESVDM